MKIKFSTSAKTWQFFRQTPSSLGKWKDVIFYRDDPNHELFDFWVVFGGIQEEEKVFCSSLNTLLIIGEPWEIKKFHPKFLSQFAHVLTTQEKLLHPGKILSPEGLPWHVGRKIIDEKNIIWSKDYDELINVRPESLSKDKLLSVISSSKTMTDGHVKRLNFSLYLKKYYGEKIDLYGSGLNPISDKWEAIAPYKYHIVLENSSLPFYFSEKLVDAFLGFSYPIYHGDRKSVV